ncbi:rhodanese-like domain-containing protein, partial [uncultured Ruminococcus sp.]
MKKYIIAALVAAAAGLLIGCAAKSTLTENTGEYSGYKQITQEEAKDMMAQDDGHIIVDVRRQDEFAAGHIPDAVCIPNETIDKMKPAELPDTEQIILIYCRSGNRSKQAAQKLADMGYTNIYEFGGIIDWDGEIITDESVNSSAVTAETAQSSVQNTADDSE